MALALALPLSVMAVSKGEKGFANDLMGDDFITFKFTLEGDIGAAHGKVFHILVDSKEATSVARIREKLGMAYLSYLGVGGSTEKIQVKVNN